MKKRILGTLLAAALVVTQAISVFAAGSKTTQATPAGDSVGKYETIEGTKENFKELAEKAPEVAEKITAINEGTATLESIVELVEKQAPEQAKQLKEKVLITKFFDVEPINGGLKSEDGKYIVTFHIPNLTETLQDVKVLHYSTERSVWEVINPENVDYAKKEITAKFEDLSPVAIIGKNTGASSSTGSTEGTSPKTGVSSDWGIYVGASVLLLGAAVVVLGRNRRRA